MNRKIRGQIRAFLECDLVQPRPYGVVDRHHALGLPLLGDEPRPLHLPGEGIHAAATPLAARHHR